jgi:prepilin-type N-terminal cleavage/methylation domain-containing protein
MKQPNRRGFSLVELLVVITVIGLLVGVVTNSVIITRARSRDAQVRADKQTLILALVRAKEADVNNQYPVTLGAGACIKAIGTCWRNNYSGNATIGDALAPYVPGGIIPKPPGSTSGQYRHDAYLIYRPNSSVGNYPAGSSFIIWPQEKNISVSECNGIVQNLDSGIWYCYEKLP